MNTKHTVFAVRLRPYNGDLKDTNISNLGLVCEYEGGFCHIGEHPRDAGTLKSIRHLQPLCLKAYHTNMPPPPKLRTTKFASLRKEVKDRWLDSLVEVDIDKDASYWLVKRIGFSNLYPQTISSEILDEIESVAYPMIEIGHTYLPLLEIKKGILQFSKEETKFQKDLSKQLGMLETYLRILDEHSMDVTSELNTSQKSNLFRYVQNLNKFLDKNIK